MFSGINFSDLVKNLPICQIKIPAKVSGYTAVILLRTSDLAKHTDAAHADHSPLLSAVESLKTVMK